ncbi:hypothetical protein LDENG_00256000, partial [Lucifuga dentata]
PSYLKGRLNFNINVCVFEFVLFCDIVIFNSCHSKGLLVIRLNKNHALKDHTIHFACLSLIYSIFIHIRSLTIIFQRIKPYFGSSNILQNLLIFQNQIFNRYTHLKNRCSAC